ncbi:uncharacterized protein G2W53_040903 [Senna tora]|uniref:Uncharacterized protein n=1 Tax=Senna tora TaxID=362788 RepID=A0A834SEB4_9FABA|nr:uncharacterized protein G2W53_040903 [Senna tora]
MTYLRSQTCLLLRPRATRFVVGWRLEMRNHEIAHCTYVSGHERGGSRFGA